MLSRLKRADIYSDRWLTPSPVECINIAAAITWRHVVCLLNISDVRMSDYPQIQSSVLLFLKVIRCMHFSWRHENGKVSKIASRHSNTHLASFGFRHNSCCYTLFRMYLLHSGKWGNFDTDSEIVFTAWELPNTLELQISSFCQTSVQRCHH